MDAARNNGSNETLVVCIQVVEAEMKKKGRFETYF